MALNPLKIATGGYLKRQTKAVLIIAVAGYLNFSDGGSGISQPDGVGRPDNSFYENQVRERKRRIARDNEIIFNVIKAFLECQG